jgi:AsmA protein
VAAATGRDLKINGDVSVSVLPNLAIEIKDVTFGNAAGGRAEHMATMKQLTVDLQLMPLLSGEVAVDKFILVEPIINLEKDAKGQGNWLMGDVKPAAAEGTAASGGQSASGGDAPGSAPAIRLGEVRLENGRVSYWDGTTGTEEIISDITMEILLPDLDSAMEMNGTLTRNGQAIAIKTRIETPRALMEGREAKISEEVTSAVVNLTFNGTAQMGAETKAAGRVSLDVPSVRELAAWGGNPLDVEGTGFGPFKVEGDLDMAGARIAFRNATIAFDEIKGSGQLSLDTGGAKPSVVATLAVEMLDVNPYLPEPVEGAGGDGTAASGGSGGSSGGAAPAGWSDEPIDMSGLNAANADLSFEAGGIRFQKFEIGKSTLRVLVKDGQLNVELGEMALYEGNANGKVELSARGETPTLAMSFDLAGVQAEPLLVAAADSDTLSGTANGRFAVTSKGGTQRRIVENLNGKGDMSFLDGAIKGINLGAMLRNVGTAFLDSGASEAQKTDFAELSGTFTIVNGILQNDDLAMKAPLFRVAGAGIVDMPARTVNYRVEPKVAATGTGQGGSDDASGVMVPIVVSGPWHDLSYQPDLAGMLTDALKDPSKIVDQVEKLGEGVSLEGAAEDVTKGAEGMLEGLTGGGDEAGAAKEGEDASPLGKVKGLFGD